MNNEDRINKLENKVNIIIRNAKYKKRFLPYKNKYRFIS